MFFLSYIITKGLDTSSTDMNLCTRCNMALSKLFRIIIDLDFSFFCFKLAMLVESYAMTAQF